MKLLLAYCLLFMASSSSAQNIDFLPFLQLHVPEAQRDPFDVLGIRREQAPGELANVAVAAYLDLERYWQREKDAGYERAEMADKALEAIRSAYSRVRLGDYLSEQQYLELQLNNNIAKQNLRGTAYKKALSISRIKNYFPDHNLGSNPNRIGLKKLQSILDGLMQKRSQQAQEQHQRALANDAVKKLAKKVATEGKQLVQKLRKKHGYPEVPGWSEKKFDKRKLIVDGVAIPDAVITMWRQYGNPQSLPPNMRPL